MLYSLFFVGLLSNLIIDRCHILSNEDPMKYGFICSVQVLSDSIFLYLSVLFSIDTESWSQLMFAMICMFVRSSNLITGKSHWLFNPVWLFSFRCLLNNL